MTVVTCLLFNKGNFRFHHNKRQSWKQSSALAQQSILCVTVVESFPFAHNVQMDVCVCHCLIISFLGFFLKLNVIEVGVCQNKQSLVYCCLYCVNRQLRCTRKKYGREREGERVILKEELFPQSVNKLHYHHLRKHRSSSL